MPLYEVTDGDRVRLVEAHSPQGADAFVRNSITLEVKRASYERVHELAMKGIRIEGKTRPTPNPENTET